MTNETIAKALKNWIPFRLFKDGEEDCCRWLSLGDEKFSEPFFDETILKCWKFSSNSSMYRPVSNLDVLAGWSQQIQSIPPTAFIFHVSRCGSTLIAQLLGLNPANIVLSEVPFFDELLRHGHKNKAMQTLLPCLKAAMKLYGAKRDEKNKHLFIKTDSWHIHFYKQLRELYPEVPFILLYRKPDEVMRSQQKRRGTQAVRGLIDPAIFNFDKDEIAGLSMEEYMAKVLESYFAAFIDILQNDKLAVPVNYNLGAISIIKKIAAVTGTVLQEDEIEAMKQRSGFHGKYPGEVFKEQAVDTLAPGYMDKAFELYNVVEGLQTSL